MALNGLYSADVPLRNCSLNHSQYYYLTSLVGTTKSTKCFADNSLQQVSENSKSNVWITDRVWKGIPCGRTGSRKKLGGHMCQISAVVRAVDFSRYTADAFG